MYDQGTLERDEFWRQGCLNGQGLFLSLGRLGSMIRGYTPEEGLHGKDQGWRE